jgi:hypothetical protein
MIPTRILGDAIELAPFGLEAVVLAAAAAAVAAVPLAVGVALDDDELAALLSAAVMSCGIIKGFPPAALRSITPSSLMTSGLAAKKLRVYLKNVKFQRLATNQDNIETYITFSATYECDQSGKDETSMLPPQVEALSLPEVWLAEYAAMAAMSES